MISSFAQGAQRRSPVALLPAGKPLAPDPQCDTDLADDLVLCLSITVVRKGIVKSIADQLTSQLRPLVLPRKFEHNLLQRRHVNLCSRWFDNSIKDRTSGKMMDESFCCVVSDRTTWGNFGWVQESPLGMIGVNYEVLG